MSNQFDLEQSIYQCWNITDELKLLKDRVCKKNLSSKEMCVLLDGLAMLYDIKFENYFSQFEDFLSEYYKIKAEQHEKRPT